MEIKQNYDVGDTVWIYGVSSRTNKITKGKVVHKFEIPGFTEVHYIVAIPTEIEPLLEVRTWHNMSQDEHGPIGAFRAINDSFESTKRFISKVGFFSAHDDGQEEQDDPSEDVIMAALEKSQAGVTHQPLVLKETKPKRRYYPKKKKQ